MIQGKLLTEPYPRLSGSQNAGLVLYSLVLWLDLPFQERRYLQLLTVSHTGIWYHSIQESSKPFEFLTFCSGRRVLNYFQSNLPRSAGFESTHAQIVQVCV